MNTVELNALAWKCRLDLLRMIQNAGSGHPGGSLSSVDLLLALFADCPDDRIVVSHGHIAAALYSVLGNSGFFDIEETIRGFRRAGSRFEGHPNTKIPGVEWCSGALGQGVSVGAGLAVGERLAGSGKHVWVVTGDGEQNKGQIQEARCLAAKFGLSNLSVIVDANGLQASGTTAEIMPSDPAEAYRLAGWFVLETDGHDFAGLERALSLCRTAKRPSMIWAHTVMGKGVPEIENRYEYHGKVLSSSLFEAAVKRLEPVAAQAPTPIHRESRTENSPQPLSLPPFLEYGGPTECRSAFGAALAEIATTNPGRTAAIDCDLAASVKLDHYAQVSPDTFFECGIAEHNAASFAAGLSRLKPSTFFADFGVFGMTEVLSQLRMADFNHTSLKVICTHCGADVGEDGKTHQAVDYLALARTLPSFRLLAPADANQCEHLVRYAASQTGNFFIVMGRSRQPVIRNRNGKLFFGADYHFQYGKADILRMSDEDCGTIITYGNFAPAAVILSDKLKSGRNMALRVICLSTPLEFDERALGLAAETGNIAVWEDHRTTGGLGTSLGNWFFEHSIHCRFRIFGLTLNGISASPAEHYRYQKIAPEDIEQYFINQER